MCSICLLFFCLHFQVSAHSTCATVYANMNIFQSESPPDYLAGGPPAAPACAGPPGRRGRERAGGVAATDRRGAVGGERHHDLQPRLGDKVGRAAGARADLIERCEDPHNEASCRVVFVSFRRGSAGYVCENREKGQEREKDGAWPSLSPRLW